MLVRDAIEPQCTPCCATVQGGPHSRAPVRKSEATVTIYSPTSALAMQAKSLAAVEGWSLLSPASSETFASEDLLPSYSDDTALNGRSRFVSGQHAQLGTCCIKALCAVANVKSSSSICRTVPYWHGQTGVPTFLSGMPVGS